jgi:hypothetical protein
MKLNEVLKMDEDFEEIDVVEEDLDDDADFNDDARKPVKKPGKAREALVLLQETCGFQIFVAPRSLVLRQKDSDRNMYFTTLGGCVREIISQDLHGKLANRELHMKKNLDSMLGVIEGHEALVKRLTADLDRINASNISR